MHWLTITSVLLLSFVSGVKGVPISVRNRPISIRNRPTSVFGICDRIGTFNMPQANLNNDWTTKVQWHSGGGEVVIKFKVGLTDLCTNMARVMGKLQGNVERMMFRKKKIAKMLSKMRK